MFSVSQTRSFEAAHYIQKPNTPDHYKMVHGHSFVVTAQCSAGPTLAEGWVVDLGELDRVLQGALAKLDHTILNEVPGLETPTLENILLFIERAMREDGLSPSRLEIARPTLGQMAVWTRD